MKTAISIPDKTFAAAERLAKARGMSRSELYRLALEQYLERHSEEAISEAFDKFYRDVDSSVDPVMKELQCRSFERAEREGSRIGPCAP